MALLVLAGGHGRDGHDRGAVELVRDGERLATAGGGGDVEGEVARTGEGGGEAASGEKAGDDGGAVGADAAKGAVLVEAAAKGHRG